MVTDDEREAIKRMRGSGHTHQEIADALGLKRTTVAYQLSKLKDTEEDISIEVIQVSSFDPKETVIGFDEYSFESHRVNSTLYAAGSDIYEMRSGVIHHTSLRAPFDGHDYTALAPILRQEGQGWYREDVGEIPRSLPGIQNGFFNSSCATVKKFCEYYKLEYEAFLDYISRGYYEAIGDIPELQQLIPKKDINDILTRLHKGPISKHILPQHTGIRKKERIELLRHLQNSGLTLVGLKENFQNAKSNLEKLFEIKEYPNPPKRDDWGNIQSRPDPLEEFGIPVPMVAYYEERGFEEKDILKVRLEKIESVEELQNIRKSGAGSKQGYDSMQNHGIEFGSYKKFTECRKFAEWLIPVRKEWGGGGYRLDSSEINRLKGLMKSFKSSRRKVIHVSDKDEGRKFGVAEFFLHPSKLSMARKIGDNIRNGAKIGLKPNEIISEDFIQLANQMGELKLEWTRKNYDWLKKQDLESIKNFSKFPSPRAAGLFDTINQSPTHHMLLESLLDSYRRNSSTPGPDIRDAPAIHKLLQGKPFTEICVSNMEGGFVERFEHGKPFLDTSKFKDLNTNASELNTEIISAINRNSVKDTLTKSWTRFESTSKELWERDLEEPLPTNGQVAVRMVDEMAELVKFTPAMVNDLHLARQMRNDVIHGNDLREDIKPKHVRRVLEATEKIIGKLN